MFFILSVICSLYEIIFFNSFISLLKQLLLPQSHARLGAFEISDLQNSSWFNEINFNKLYEKSTSSFPKASRNMWVPKIELSNPMKYYSRDSTQNGGSFVSNISNSQMSKLNEVSDVFDSLDTSGYDDADDYANNDYERRWYHEF